MEFFITGNSFAAPFLSDPLEAYIEAPTAKKAIEVFLDGNPHPVGVYASNAYTSADDYHKGKPPACKWRSNAALVSQAGGDPSTCLNPRQGQFVA